MQLFIPNSALRQVHRIFQNKFFTEDELVFPHSVFSIFSFFKAMQ
jgi:hypothetical protein